MTSLSFMSIMPDIYASVVAAGGYVMLAELMMRRALTVSFLMDSSPLLSSTACHPMTL